VPTSSPRSRSEAPPRSAATARKSKLKRSIRRSQLVQKFDLPRIPIRNLAFRTVARTMLEEAQQQKVLHHGGVPRT
jgi:hypothetical protein